MSNYNGAMDLVARLTLLEDLSLIRSVSDEPAAFAFRHALLREATYESLLKADRRNLHQVVGETLTQLYGESDPVLAPVLAHHFAEAGQLALALRYFLRAAAQAAEHYANSEALNHYTEAHALAARLAEQAPVALEVWRDIYLGRGRVLELHSRHLEALADYEHLLTLAQVRAQPTVELAALMALAVLRITPTKLHNLAMGAPLGQRALALAEQLGDQRAQARANWLMALLHHYQHEAAEAVRYGERAVQQARVLQWEEQLAFALNDLYAPYEMLGQSATAQAALGEAVQLWRRLRNWPMLADSLGNLAGEALQAGAWTEFFAYTREIRAISTPIGNVWGQTYAEWLDSMAYVTRGEWARGLEVAQLALQLGEHGGLLDAQVSLRKLRALTLGALGAAAAGWAEFDHLQQLLRAFPHYQPQTQNVAIWLHWLNAEAEVAQRLWEDYSSAYPLDKILPNARHPLWLTYIEWALQTGQPATARALIDRVLVAPQPQGPKACYGLLLGRTHAALGEWPAAHAALQTALYQAEERHWHALALAICATGAGWAAPAPTDWLAQLQARLQPFVAALPPAYRAIFLQKPLAHYQLLYIL